jgi:CRISPR/Cas system CSM-associated protein Csm3 (group 7 of RAMP superfamily)
MTDYLLKITLLSDATFGRGDGVAGLVDAEVQHDKHGLPYLGGRTLKGLLGAECDDLLFALQEGCPGQRDRWKRAADRLFGTSGAALKGEGILRVGAAQLPDDLRTAVARDVREEKWTRAEILGMLTTLRRQTAMDPQTGAPKKETLRTMRVVLRDAVFWAKLSFPVAPDGDDLALLAACVKALRRAGTVRNRGRGKLRAELCDANGDPVTEIHFRQFGEAVLA